MEEGESKMMRLDIQRFGGRGASSSVTKAQQETPSIINTREEEKIPTFTGSKNFDKARENGYMYYNRDDLRVGGRNYEEIAKRLKEEGYKVRVYEEATRVRGIHNYTILYKRGK